MSTTEYTSRENHRRILEELRGRLGDVDASMDAMDDKLTSLLTQGMATPFYFEVDSKGDIYVYYDDAYGPPSVEYDAETGNFYWVFYTDD